MRIIITKCLRKLISTQDRNDRELLIEGCRDGCLKQFVFVEQDQGRKLTGTVTHHEDTAVMVNLRNHNHGTNFKGDIEFTPNSYNYNMQKQALRKFDDFELYEKLISPIATSNQKTRDMQQNTPQHDYTSSSLNAEQISAVQSIITMGIEMPFVLCGPPGTDKTQTVVQAAKVLIEKCKKKILICAQSNSVSDELALRLLDALKVREEMLRMYAINYRRPMDKLRKYSNYDESTRAMTNIAPNQLANLDVIVCTVAASPQLFQTKAKKKHSNSTKNQFDYLFIDEAASVSEAMTLVPITGKQ